MDILILLFIVGVVVGWHFLPQPGWVRKLIDWYHGSAPATQNTPAAPPTVVVNTAAPAPANAPAVVPAPVPQDTPAAPPTVVVNTAAPAPANAPVGIPQ
jgi:hypothetical protein